MASVNIYSLCGFPGRDMNLGELRALSSSLRWRVSLRDPLNTVTPSPLTEVIAIYKNTQQRALMKLVSAAAAYPKYLPINT
jgi:hypothetical protein